MFDEEIQIREMRREDAPAVLSMMRLFYASSAVFTNGSEQIFQNDINACLSENPYLEGYVFEGYKGVIGYAMLAKSYSTEYGMPCIWIEDIYIQESGRSKGIGGKFFSFIKQKYQTCLLKLEVEEENIGAIRFYQRQGFEKLPYTELIWQAE